METTARSQRKQSNAPVKRIVQPCPNRTIDLQYLTWRGDAVAGAKYHVFSVNSAGKPDGVYDKKGSLDGQGSAHISGVPDLAFFRYYFEKDPEAYVPAIKPIKEPDKQRAESMLGGIIEWMVGAIQGDFNKNQSPGQLTINVLFGLIPGFDQALDARDLFAGAKDLADYHMMSPDEQSSQPDVLGLDYEHWLWLNLLISAIGCVPTIGSAVKGFLKGIIVQLKTFGKTAVKLSARQLRQCWNYLIAVLNFFGEKGNAHRWIKSDFPSNIQKWMKDAADFVVQVIQTIRDECDAVIAIVRKFSDTKAQEMATRSKPFLDRVGKINDDVHKKANELADWFKQQASAIQSGSHKTERAAATGLEGTKNINVRLQNAADGSVDKAFAIILYREKIKKAFMKVAKENKVIIEVRKVSDDVIERLMEGCHPKPPNLHMKSKNDLDELIGASPKAKNGEVVLFKPKLPEDVAMRRQKRENLKEQLRGTDPNDPKRKELIDEMKKTNAERSAKEDDAIYQRYRERQAEYQRYEGEFIRNKSMPEGRDSGIDTKPLKGGIEVDENGVLRSNADGKSFTGDQDLFAIKDKQGKTLSMDKAEDRATIAKVRKELASSDAATQHGAHMNMKEELGYNRDDKLEGKKYRDLSNEEKMIYDKTATAHGIDPASKKPIPKNERKGPSKKLDVYDGT